MLFSFLAISGPLTCICCYRTNCYDYELCLTIDMLGLFKYCFSLCTTVTHSGNIRYMCGQGFSSQFFCLHMSLHTTLCFLQHEELQKEKWQTHHGENSKGSFLTWWCNVSGSHRVPSSGKLPAAWLSWSKFPFSGQCPLSNTFYTSGAQALFLCLTYHQLPLKTLQKIIYSNVPVLPFGA